LSIFYPAHSSVLYVNREGVKEGNIYSTTEDDSKVLTFSRAVPNYVSYLNSILHPTEEEKSKSAFNGKLDSAIKESGGKTIAYVYASADSPDGSMDKLVDAKAYITSIGANQDRVNAILYGSMPAQYDSADGGIYYVDTEQKRLGFKNASTNNEFEFFTYEKKEFANGDEAYEIPVYYFDKDAGEKPKANGAEISEEEVSHIGLVKKNDHYVVEYVKLNSFVGGGKKYPISQYSGRLSFNPLYLRQDQYDETTKPTKIYTAQTAQTIDDPNGGDYIFEAQETTADDDILIYSIKTYDIFGNVYEPDHDPVFLTFDANKLDIDSISKKTYTGKAITLSDSDIKFRYGELFKGEEALSVADMDEIGVGYEITSYSDNVNVGTAKVTIKIFDKDDPSLFRNLEGSFQIEDSGKPEPAPETKDISSCTVSGIVARTYNGKAQTQDVTIKDGTSVLKAGTDYTVSYKNNTDAGTANLTITGKGNYKGTITKTFVINKAANTMTVKAKKITAKANKKTSFKKSKVFKIKKAKGKVTFKKTKGSNKITISKKGKLTVKKGLKKGKTYTVKVKVTAAGSKNYKSKSKTVKIKVKVK
jgi:hypothetical protein